MARTSTYLNFARETEQAFNFYKSVFGGEFIGGMSRYKDMPVDPNSPACKPGDENLVMHVELAITGGHSLMGTDATESMGFKLNQGNNVYINLEPDTKEEADYLFSSLSADGKIEMPMQDMFWGAYFGSFADKFGVNWMVNCAKK